MLLSGGSTMYAGFGLSKELTALAPASMEVKIMRPGPQARRVDRRQHRRELPNFHPMWISKQEYDESGPLGASVNHALILVDPSWVVTAARARGRDRSAQAGRPYCCVALALAQPGQLRRDYVPPASGTSFNELRRD